MDLLSYLSQQISEATFKGGYRRNMVKALINSYPEGTPIKVKEFAKALQYKPDSSGPVTMLNRLIDRGEISRQAVKEASGGHIYSYKVLVPGDTYDKERQDLALKREGYVNPAQVHAQRIRRAKESALLEQLDQAEEANPPREGFSFDELEAKAIKFVFYHPTGSVADFIKNIKED